MHKITVTTYYEFTDAGFRDYMELFKETQPPENYQQFIDTGRAERKSVDPDGSSATTTHQVLE